MRASRKPSSVRNFRSWVTIYLGLSLPAGSCDYQERDGPPLNAPIPILHRVGFTWRTSRQAAGELLPRLSILTAQVRRYISVALSLESPPPDVIRHPALWSSDFPHAGRAARSHLAYSLKPLFCFAKCRGSCRSFRIPQALCRPQRVLPLRWGGTCCSRRTGCFPPWPWGLHGAFLRYHIS